MGVLSGRRNFRRTIGAGLIFANLCRRLYAMGLFSKDAQRVLLWLILVSVIFLAVPDLFYILLFSGIGIPLLPFYFLSSAIALIWAFVMAFYFILPLRGQLAKYTAMLATAVVLSLPAQWFNLSAADRVASLTAGDVNSVAAPLQSATLGVVRRGNWAHDSCGPICLHALLSETASTVVVGHTKVSESAPDPKASATAYYFEHRESCPTVKLEPRKYEVAYFNRRGRARVNAAELALQKIGFGHCLLSRDARLDEADTLIVSGAVFDERTKKNDTGFDFTLKGLKASRISVYRRVESGGFNEVFRKTNGDVTRFAPMLLPVPGFPTELRSGWLRLSYRFGSGDYRYIWNGDVLSTLVETLEFDLSFDQDDYQRSAQASILASLDEDRAFTEPERLALNSYWEALRFHQAELGRIEPDARDVEIGTRLAGLTHIPLPRSYSRFVEYTIDSEIAAAERIAEGLAARLRDVEDRKDLMEAAIAMSSLPESILRDHVDLFEELANNPAKRPHLVSLLHNIYLRGPEAAPNLVALTQAGLKDNDIASAVSGLVGLCRIGPAAQEAFAQLDETQFNLDRSGTISYGGTRIAVSARIGIAPDTLLRSLPPEVTALADIESIDWHYKRGLSQRSHCLSFR